VSVIEQDVLVLLAGGRRSRPTMGNPGVRGRWWVWSRSARRLVRPSRLGARCFRSGPRRLFTAYGAEILGPPPSLSDVS